MRPALPIPLATPLVLPVFACEDPAGPPGPARSPAQLDTTGTQALAEALANSSARLPENERETADTNLRALLAGAGV